MSHDTPQPNLAERLQEPVCSLRREHLHALIDHAGAEADLKLARGRTQRLIARVALGYHSRRLAQLESRLFAPSVDVAEVPPIVIPEQRLASD